MPSNQWNSGNSEVFPISQCVHVAKLAVVLKVETPPVSCKLLKVASTYLKVVVITIYTLVN